MHKFVNINKFYLGVKIFICYEKSLSYQIYENEHFYSLLHYMLNLSF